MRKIILVITACFLVGGGLILFFILHQGKEEPLEPFSGQMQTIEGNTEKTESQSTEQPDISLDTEFDSTKSENENTTVEQGTDTSSVEKDSNQEKIKVTEFCFYAPKHVQLSETAKQIVLEQLVPLAEESIEHICNYDGYTEEWFNSMKAYRTDAYDGTFMESAHFPEAIRDCFADRKIKMKVKKIEPMAFEIVEQHEDERYFTGVLHGLIRCVLSYDGKQAKECTVRFNMFTGNIKKIDAIDYSEIRLIEVAQEIYFYQVAGKPDELNVSFNKKMTELQTNWYEENPKFSYAQYLREKNYNQQMEEFED